VWVDGFGFRVAGKLEDSGEFVVRGLPSVPFWTVTVDGETTTGPVELSRHVRVGDAVEFDLSRSK
jgi:hypothetical protein